MPTESAGVARRFIGFFISASLEERTAGIRAVNHRVAHSARLISGRLVVRRPNGPLDRKRMALQAQKIDLADAQHPWIGRPMRSVATVAAFGFDWDMLEHEGALLIGVALVANRITTRERLDLSERGCPVHIVTIAALNKALVHTMVIRLCEVCRLRKVAAIAQCRLGFRQQVLGLRSFVRRVAVEAADIAAGMNRAGEVALLEIFAVAA